MQSCIISRKWTIERWDVLFSRKGVRGTFNHCLVKVTPYRFLYICLGSEKKGLLKNYTPFCQISQWFLSHEQNPWLRIGSSRIWGSCYFISNGNLQFTISYSTVSLHFSLGRWGFKSQIVVELCPGWESRFDYLSKS